MFNDRHLGAEGSIWVDERVIISIPKSCTVIGCIEFLHLIKLGTMMEFLDITLTKDSSLLLYTIHSLFYSSLVLKIRTKNKRRQENSSLFMNSMFLNGKMMVENQTKTQD
jgi:hypothetical protein